MPTAKNTIDIDRLEEELQQELLEEEARLKDMMIDSRLKRARRPTRKGRTQSDAGEQQQTASTNQTRTSVEVEITHTTSDSSDDSDTTQEPGEHQTYQPPGHEESEEAPREQEEVANGGMSGPSAPSLTRTGSTYFRRRGDTRKSSYNKKSLFFCLVVDNPWDPEAPEQRIVRDTLFQGQEGGSDGCSSTHLQDDDLLKIPRDDDAFPIFDIDKHVKKMDKTLVELATKTDEDAKRHDQEVLHHDTEESPAPNKFQKIMEILLRLEKKGVDYSPKGMMREVPENLRDVQRIINPNYFFGYQLVEDAVLTSPDKDELYILIHSAKPVLLKFAEQQNIIMVTNRFSFGGGSGMSYSAAMDARLKDSVMMYAHNFKIRKEFIGKDMKGWGFRVDVPQKMRIGVRLLREAWQFGGCGIPINDMKRREVLVRNFFPLHNTEYLKAYNMTEWSSLKSIFSWKPLDQDQHKLVQYFGERVALYFVWLRKYTLYLRSAALMGAVVSCLDLLGISKSLLNALFCFFITLWGVAWNQKWQLAEGEFGSHYGQEIEMDQELVRDEFMPVKYRHVGVDDVFELKFSIPTTLQRRSDGTMVEQYYPPRLRQAIRVFFTYPVVFALTAALIYSMLQLTDWRYRHENDKFISYGASIATVVTAVAFGKVFDFVVPFLNRLENNRTEHEEENQYIIKSFFFYFFSSYFALFAIALWDIEGPAYRRLIELESQMIIISVAKPMLQNVQEIFFPWFLTQLRRRVDTTGGYCAAIASILTCKTLHKDIIPAGTFKTEEGRRIWKEAQREPYESTAQDYLEIALQFGYMSMFAAVFPWAALAALLYNILELRIDANKMINFHQRPLARTAQSIGAWKWIFAFLTGLSIITNSYLVCVLSPAPKKVGLETDDVSRYQYFCNMQYTIILCILTIRFFFGSEPDVIAKRKVKRTLLRDKNVRDKMLRTMRENYGRLRTENRDGDEEVVEEDDFVVVGSVSTPQEHATLPPADAERNEDEGSPPREEEDHRPADELTPTNKLENGEVHDEEEDEEGVECIEALRKEKRRSPSPPSSTHSGGTEEVEMQDMKREISVDPSDDGVASDNGAESENSNEPSLQFFGIIPRLPEDDEEDGEHTTTTAQCEAEDNGTTGGGVDAEADPPDHEGILNAPVSTLPPVGGQEIPTDAAAMGGASDDDDGIHVVVDEKDI